MGCRSCELTFVINPADVFAGTSCSEVCLMSKPCEKHQLTVQPNYIYWNKQIQHRISLSWYRRHSSCTRTIQHVVVSEFFYITIKQRCEDSGLLRCYIVPTGKCYRFVEQELFRRLQCRTEQEIHFMPVIFFQAIILIKILFTRTSARFLTILDVCIKGYNG
jgi:hypothetical protein